MKPLTVPPAITGLLGRWSAGDREAAERVLPLVYTELRRIAARQLRQERREHTLQATAIVNEAYLRLAERRDLCWPSRAHFFAYAARLVRHVLVDYARRRRRDRRGRGLRRVDLAAAERLGRDLPGGDLMALDDALTALEALDPRKAAVVELRFFAGLSIEETAAQLGVSPETVSREWRRARAWLHDELRPPAAGT